MQMVMYILGISNKGIYKVMEPIATQIKMSMKESLLKIKCMERVSLSLPMEVVIQAISGIAFLVAEEYMFIPTRTDMKGSGGWTGNKD